MGVGRRTVLRHSDIFPYLPLKVGVLIDLAAEAWSEDHILSAMEQGVIKPDATRSEIRKWHEAQMVGEPEDESGPDGADFGTELEAGEVTSGDDKPPEGRAELKPLIQPGFVTVFKSEAHTSLCDRNKLNPIERDLKQGLDEALRLKHVDSACIKANACTPNLQPI